MANRHLSRGIVLQTLFELDFNGGYRDSALHVLRRNAQEFAPGLGDFSFMENLILGVIDKREDLN